MLIKQEGVRWRAAHQSNMHRLQQHILHQLIMNADQRYSDLKPAEVEGNLFMYHLRALLKENLVEKTEAGRYRLTPTGKRYVDRLSLKSFTPRIQPKIVTLLAVQNAAGEWLMYRRKRQPLIDSIGFPYGKIHLNESIVDAAHRELKEKTGLNLGLEHRGDGYASTFEDGQPISQIFFHLFAGQTDGAAPTLAASEVGEALWLPEEQFARSDIMPNVPDLLKLIKEPATGRFFVELSHHL